MAEMSWEVPPVMDEDSLRFETYRNYLQRFCNHTRASFASWDEYAGACSLATRSLKPLAEPDVKWVRRFLNIVWNTEVLVAQQPEDIELARINNAWLPVQAYYAVYAMSEALAYAIDGQRAGGHAKALRKVTAFLIQYPISPFNLAFTGPCGKDNKRHVPRNFPDDVSLAHNLSTTARDIDVIARCLKAEHYNRIKEGYKRSRGYKYKFDPGPTGLLHFLYRLRIRSNYRGVELFIKEGQESDIRSFADSLNRIVGQTFTYFEIALLRKLKRKTVAALASDFVVRNAKAASLKLRFAHYKTLY